MRAWCLLLPLLAVPLMSATARAQCTSNASSCVTCHETQGMRPVLTSAQPWHVQHGYGDLCVACHAGDPEAASADLAHAGRRHPLADPSASCGGCHDDAAARAERYQEALAAEPSESALTTPGTERSVGATASAPSAPRAAPPSTHTADRVLAVLALLLSVVLAALWRHQRGPLRFELRAWLRAKTWSPYAAGALLGLVVAHSALVAGRPIAVAGAFDKLAAYPGRWFFPDSPYYTYVMTPGITFQVWLVLGLLVGAFGSSRLADEARLRWLPDTQWVPRFGPSRALRLGLAFLGAVLVQVGAGIAGGCTSGLAISGGAALAPGAFLFMAGMFAGGIPAAWLIYRGRGA